MFDYDVFRGKDVRILVDGDEVARMPAPTAESPRQEISLSVEGHQLLATGLGALWLGSAGARLVWNEVLRRRGWSERRQSIVGLAGVVAAFVVAYGSWVLVVIMIAQRSASDF